MGEGNEETKPWEPTPDEQRMEEGYQERTRVLSVLELEELFQNQAPDLNGTSLVYPYSTKDLSV